MAMEGLRLRLLLRGRGKGASNRCTPTVNTITGWGLRSFYSETFGDCLIMAHYKHQVTFCKVVTTGEGDNYYNEATLAPDSFPPISPNATAQIIFLACHLVLLGLSPPSLPKAEATEHDTGHSPSVAGLHRGCVSPLSLSNGHLSPGAALAEGKS